MTTSTTITKNEFDVTYPLLSNHFDPNASWASGDGNGCLFETYGEELDFVRRQDPQTIWTIVDTDDGDQMVISGYHHVNRVGYLISTTRVPENQVIHFIIPMNPEKEH